MLEAGGIEVRTVALDEGGVIPALDRFDAVWVLGGPQRVWQEEEHPWLRAEKAAIREAVVDRGLPFFGLCLGHQLLADSLGGEVGPSKVPEVGILPVRLTAAGRRSALFQNLPPVVKCTQGHGAEVKTPPPASVVLAASLDCRVQALACGERAFDIQFHSELTLEMIDACLELPEYRTYFEATMGVEGVARFGSALWANGGYRRVFRRKLSARGMTEMEH